jgi:hypothetical protein
MHRKRLTMHGLNSVGEAFGLVPHRGTYRQELLPHLGYAPASASDSVPGL